MEGCLIYYGNTNQAINALLPISFSKYYPLVNAKISLYLNRASSRSVIREATRIKLVKLLVYKGYSTRNHVPLYL